MAKKAARPGKRPFISVCMIAKDEEAFIGRAVASAQDLGAEVLVGDTGSRDRTVEIARAQGARVWPIPWHDDFAEAKNAVIEQARGRWIVMLDADEWFAPGHALRLRRLIERYHQNLAVAGFSVYQTNLQHLDQDEILDKSRTVRVFRNRPDARYQWPIHEQIIQSLHGQVLSTDIELMHAGFTVEVTQRKKKTDRNARILQKLIQSLDEHHPHRIYLTAQLGRERQRAGRIAEAEVLYREALERFYAGIQSGRAEPGNFGAVLFSYLEEALEKQGKYQQMLELAQEMAPYVRFPYADQPFFQALALYHLGRHAEALGYFLAALACFDAAPLAQEYLSSDRLVLAYAGAIQAFLRASDLVHAYQLWVQGINRFPERTAFLQIGVALWQRLPAADRESLVAALAPAAVTALAHQALMGGDGALVLKLAERALKDGLDPASLVWAAYWALEQGHYGQASLLLQAVPADHRDGLLARRLDAMSQWLDGQPERFESWVQCDPDPAWSLALKVWAGRELDWDQEAVAMARLRELETLVKRPVVPATASRASASAITREGVVG